MGCEIPTKSHQLSQKPKGMITPPSPHPPCLTSPSCPKVPCFLLIEPILKLQNNSQPAFFGGFYYPPPPKKQNSRATNPRAPSARAPSGELRQVLQLLAARRRRGAGGVLRGAAPGAGALPAPGIEPPSHRGTRAPGGAGGAGGGRAGGRGGWRGASVPGFYGL